MIRWIVKAGATSLDDLVRQDVPIPNPAAGEVRIKMHAVSLNARDQLLVTGKYGTVGADFIAISDGAGEIDAVGPDVDGWSLGDRVTGFYFPSWMDGPPAPDQGWGLGSEGQDGMLAEYVVQRADRVTRPPVTLSFEEAACLPCAALTAWTALNGDRPYTDPLDKSDRVLVTGTGSVALFSILFARALGAEVVATTSDADKVGKVRVLGASATFDYKKQANWGELAAQSSGGFDRVVNAAGGSAMDQSIAALAPGGVIAFMGLFDQAKTPPNFIALMTKGGSIRGTAVGSALAYRDMVEFIDAHGIKPSIGQVFSMADAREAYQAAASGEVFGKIVIKVTADAVGDVSID